jgi:hypothetical protein
MIRSLLRAGHGREPFRACGNGERRVWRVPPLRSGPGCARRRARYNCAQRRRAPGAPGLLPVPRVPCTARRCLAPAGAHPSRNYSRPGTLRIRRRALSRRCQSTVEFSPLREVRAGRGRGRGPSRTPAGYLSSSRDRTVTPNLPQQFWGRWASNASPEGAPRPSHGRRLPRRDTHPLTCNQTRAIICAPSQPSRHSDVASS